MIHDLLFALNGWPGDLFSEKVLPNGHVIVSFNGDAKECAHLLADSLGGGDLLVRGELCAIASSIRRIRRFILSHQKNEEDRSRGVYMSQFALALSAFLRDVYEPLLVRIEKDYLASCAGSITPLSLLADLGKYADALRAFVFILNHVADGVPVLNAAWGAYSKLDTGVISESSKAVENVLVILVTPFINQLEEWLSVGKISADRDPFNEFFIESVSSSTGAASGAKQWELRCERLPPFVDMATAQKALTVGELRRELSSARSSSFTLLRALTLEQNGFGKDQSLAVFSFGDKLPRTIASAVVRAHHSVNVEMALQLVSAGALKLISQCCELSFMTRGELFSTWFHSPTVIHVLRSASTDCADKYASVLGAELRIAAQRLYTTSRHDAINLSLDSAQFNIESLPGVTDLLLPKFRLFLFPVTSIPPGLSRVFSSEAVQQYKLVFNYLVFLRLASSALNNAWHSLLTSRRGIKGRHQQKWVNSTRSEFAQLARMSRALSALEEHAFHVIRTQRDQFLAVAKQFEFADGDSVESFLSAAKKHDCDTFIMAHAKMISQISHELIQPNQNYRLRTSLVSCVLKATTTGSPSGATASTTIVSPSSIDQSSDFDKFAPLLSLLLRQQTLILGSLSILPLHSLLLSLDFNEFYSQQQ